MNKEEESVISLIKDESITIPDTEELEKMLYDELAKDSPDFDLVEEISEFIAQNRGFDPYIDVKSKISDIKHHVTRRRQKSRIMKFSLTAAASLVLMGNIITVNANGESFIAAIINQTQNSINFDFKEDRRFDGEGSQRYDPYNIKRQCEEYGFIPEAPMYLPSILNYSVSDKTDINEESGYFEFRFASHSSSFTALYFVYDDPENIKELSINNEMKDYREVTVNDHSAILGTYVTNVGSEFYGITYRKGNVVANFFFEQISSDEIDKIIQSIE
ncbi:MAG: DUF4367 domain-containing protein [Ruminococcus sp.]|nr:DUF4367 domain-containing protein [Ruminococcus sp.]